MPACAVLVVSPPALGFSEPQDITCLGINLEVMVFRFVKFDSWAVVICPAIVWFAVEFTAEELWFKLFADFRVYPMQELSDVGYRLFPLFHWSGCQETEFLACLFILLRIFIGVIAHCSQ